MPVPLLTLTAVLAMMLLVWIASVIRRDASIVDVFWGLGFVLFAWIAALSTPETSLRGRLVLALVTIWGLRLSAHILWRGWGEEEDPRYRAMRERHGERFPLVSLFSVFLLQGVLLWAIAMPLYQVQRVPEPPWPAWLDAAGVVLFAAGFFFEVVGDWQLARFKADPANRGRVLDRGLWRTTRHPNYFGDALLWWGFAAFALATHGGWWTLYSPVVMTFLLMRVSGVPLLEKRLERTRPEYADYVRRTNAFFPGPRKG